MEKKMDPENDESRWYDGLIEIICAIAIFAALIYAHCG